MTTIKAIETQYKGYRFRSRLEARWAVFFDVFVGKWEYEKEGYDLGEMGWYLPDFLLDGASVRAAWVEIKPNSLSAIQSLDETINKCEDLCMLTGYPVALICGDPWPKEYNITYFQRDIYRPCEFHGIKIKNLNFSSGGHLALEPIIDDELMAAYTAARSARFEHGETPR